jgi:hypothetical protein
MKLTYVMVACAVLLTACGGGGSKYDDARAVATAAGFSSCEPDDNVISTDAVDCDQGRVNWFKSDSALNGWRKVADAASDAGVSSATLYGDRWAIECGTLADCKAAEEKIGGKIE